MPSNNNAKPLQIHYHLHSENIHRSPKMPKTAHVIETDCVESLTPSLLYMAQFAASVFWDLVCEDLKSSSAPEDVIDQQAPFIQKQHTPRSWGPCYCKEYPVPRSCLRLPPRCAQASLESSATRQLLRLHGRCLVRETKNLHRSWS